MAKCVAKIAGRGDEVNDSKHILFLRRLWPAGCAVLVKSALFHAPELRNGDRATLTPCGGSIAKTAAGR